MARPRQEWVRIDCDLYRSAEWAQMRPEQRAVYIALVLYAGEQTPRGTIDVSNMEHLAHQVAFNDEQLLKSVLRYCHRTWKNHDDQPHIDYVSKTVVKFTDDTPFRSKPSDSSDAIATRVEEHKLRKALEAQGIADNKRVNNGSLTPTQYITVTETEHVTTQETLHSQKHSSALLRRLDAEGVEVFGCLFPGCEPTARDLAYIKRVLVEFRDIDGPTRASRYREWQEVERAKERDGLPAKVHRDLLKGWRNAMKNAAERGWYQRKESEDREQRGLRIVPKDSESQGDHGPPQATTGDSLWDSFQTFRAEMLRLGIRGAVDTDEFASLSLLEHTGDRLVLGTTKDPAYAEQWVHPAVQRVLDRLRAGTVQVEYRHQVAS